MDVWCKTQWKYFSEARYYLNIKSMAIFDHHANISAAALGLEILLPSMKFFNPVKILQMTFHFQTGPVFNYV